MNRQSAGNQIELTYQLTGTILETAKKLNLKYAQVRSYLTKHTNYVSKKKKPTMSQTYRKDYFEEINTPDKAYFLGFLKADGYIDKNRNRVALRLQEKDVEILRKFCDVLQLPQSRINKIKSKRDGQSDGVEIAITNEQFVAPILDIKESSILAKIPEEFSTDFIRGYFDGDGTIAYRNKQKLYFSVAIVGSPNDDHMLQYICKYIRGFTKIYTDKRSNLPYLKTDKKSVIALFRDTIYKDCFIYLTRKKTKFDEFKLLFETSTTTRETSLIEDEDIV